MTVLKLVTKILKNKNIISSLNDSNDDFFTKLFQIKMVLEKNTNFEGMTRKIQLKPLEYDTETLKVKKALLILKWGGSLTHAGIEQAYTLGSTFCRLYPSNQENDEDGLIRLHMTYRHDLKCYSADEGRCLKTAASFLKGLLQLDGPIIPIISSMVTSDEDRNKLLDVSSDDLHEFKEKIKKQMSECLNYDGNIKDKFNSMFTKESIYANEENSESSDDTDELKENEEDECVSSDLSEDDNNNIEEKKIEFKENEKKSEEKQEFPLYELLDKIENPLKRMKNILVLMKDVIKNI
jgi:hypothetical protein